MFAGEEGNGTGALVWFTPTRNLNPSSRTNGQLSDVPVQFGLHVVDEQRQRREQVVSPMMARPHKHISTILYIGRRKNNSEDTPTTVVPSARKHSLLTHTHTQMKKKKGMIANSITRSVPHDRQSQSVEDECALDGSPPQDRAHSRSCPGRPRSVATRTALACRPEPTSDP
jgi:hypothetical protein